MHLATIIVVILVTKVVAQSGPGVLQLQIEGLSNPHGRDAVGRCCVLPSNSSSSAPSCPGQCRTFFRVCAARVGPNWPNEPDLRQHTLACPLGLLVTPAVARNTLDPHRDGILLMRFPYREWPGKLKLTIEAWHDVTGELFVNTSTDATRDDDLEDDVARLILRLERRHRLTLGKEWLRRSAHITVPKGDVSRKPNRRISLTYALRLVPPSASPPPPLTTTTTTTTTLEPETDEETDSEEFSPIYYYTTPSGYQAKSNISALINLSVTDTSKEEETVTIQDVNPTTTTDMPTTAEYYNDETTITQEFEDAETTLVADTTETTAIETVTEDEFTDHPPLNITDIITKIINAAVLEESQRVTEDQTETSTTYDVNENVITDNIDTEIITTQPTVQNVKPKSKVLNLW